MFRNSTRDPLAVPEPVRRASIGPSRRTAWAETKLPGLKQHETQDLDHQSWGGDEDGGDYWGQEEHDPNSVIGPNYTSQTPGYGGVDERGYNQVGPASGTMPGSPAEAWRLQRGVQPTHEPRSADMGFSRDDVNRLKSQIPGPVARVIERQARDFMASDEADTPDSRELLYRAERHARTQTSSWSVEASQRATQAFCARVAQLLPKTRKQAVKAATHIADFDDYLLY